MLGVIGGSGLYQVDDINILDEVNISTPMGSLQTDILLPSTGERKLSSSQDMVKGINIHPTL